MKEVREVKAKRQLKLSFKIWIGYLSLIILSAFFSYTSYQGFMSVRELVRINQIYENFLQREIDHLNWANSLRRQMVSSSDINIQQDPTQCALGRWFYGEGREQTVQYFPAIESYLESIEGPHNRLHASSQKIQQLVQIGERVQAMEVYQNETEAALIEIQSIFLTGREYLEGEIQQLGENSEAIVGKAVQVLFWGGVLLVLLGLLIAFVVTRFTVAPIQKAIDALKLSSSDIDNASNDLLSQSTSLAEASTESASSLQETVSSVDEISSMIQRNADSANSSSKVSLSSTDAANKGKQIVETMIGSIEGISQSNDDIAKEMKQNNEDISKIVDVISEIGEKTKVINDIVFQTKLLSFNASVEAARAGEHGKGFAVVAEEVGNLASMSGSAAHEITEMLEGSIRQVRDIVDKATSKIDTLIDTSKQRIEMGTSNARECGEALDEIINNVTTVNEMVREIANASNEQAQGVKEVTGAMQQLDGATHQNTLIAQDSAILAQKLKDCADGLKSEVQYLVTILSGKAEDSQAIEYTGRENKDNVVPLHVDNKSLKKEGQTKIHGEKVVGLDNEDFNSSDDEFEEI